MIEIPRAKRRCAKVECKNYQPCPTHPGGWASNKVPLPPDWKRKVRAVKQRAEWDGWKCANCRKPTKNGEVDHIINRKRGGSDELTNLQWLCKVCHTLKTLAEKRYGIEKRKRRG